MKAKDHARRIKEDPSVDNYLTVLEQLIQEMNNEIKKGKFSRPIQLVTLHNQFRRKWEAVLSRIADLPITVPEGDKAIPIPRDLGLAHFDRLIKDIYPDLTNLVNTPIGVLRRAGKVFRC